MTAHYDHFIIVSTPRRIDGLCLDCLKPAMFEYDRLLVTPQGVSVYKAGLTVCHDCYLKQKGVEH